MTPAPSLPRRAPLLTEREISWTLSALDRSDEFKDSPTRSGNPLVEPLIRLITLARDRAADHRAALEVLRAAIALIGDQAHTIEHQRALIAHQRDEIRTLLAGRRIA